MNNDIKELAKINVREAMRKEIELNQEIIEVVVKRNTSREIKEKVFIAMARKNVLLHFLNRVETEQTIQQLYSSCTMSDEYLKLMRKLGATRYPLVLKRIAERKLIYDYTHVDYKGERHFLDEELALRPEVTNEILPFRHKLSNHIIEMISIILGFIFTSLGVILSYGLIILVIVMVIASIFYPNSNSSSLSSYHRSSSSTGRSTFGGSGISGGNSVDKPISDNNQVKDDSGKVGFGNGGVSGHDSTGVQKDENSKLPVSKISSNTNTNVNTPVVNKNNLFVKYSIQGDMTKEFEIQNNESVNVQSEQMIVVDFYIPMNSGAVYHLNGKEIKVLSTATNENITWLKFKVEVGENVITVKLWVCTIKCVTSQVNGNTDI